MIVYGILVGLTVFVYLLFTALHYEKSSVDKITLTFFFVVYLLLLCCRDVSVGNDTRSYVKMEYEAAADELARAQNALDMVNSTATFETEIE